MRSGVLAIAQGYIMRVKALSWVGVGYFGCSQVLFHVYGKIKHIGKPFGLKIEKFLKKMAISFQVGTM